MVAMMTHVQRNDGNKKQAKLLKGGNPKAWIYKIARHRFGAALLETISGTRQIPIQALMLWWVGQSSNETPGDWILLNGDNVVFSGCCWFMTQ